MLKKIAAAMGASVDDGDEDISSNAQLRGDNVEVVIAKLTTTHSFPPRAWVTLTYLGKESFGESSIKHTNIEKPIGDNFSDTHKWWVFKEHFPVSKDTQFKIEFKAQFEKVGVVTLGSAIILSNSLAEEVCEFDLSSSASSSKQVEYSDIDLHLYTCAVGLRLVPRPPPVLPDPTTGKIKNPPPHLGIALITTWQGKNVQSSYPVYLEVSLNQLGSRKYRGPAVNNPHNPIFDHMAAMDLTSLQGDIIVVLKEKHAVRSNRAVGQVTVPLSWLTDKISVLDVSCTSASLEGWFEMFPCTKPMRLNRCGQYRPYIAGMPASSCYGLEKPEKPLGFLKISFEMTLNQSMFYTLAKYPFCLMPNTSHDDTEDETGLASVYVARNNIKRIINVARLPLYVSTLLDIIHWKVHWSITFSALYLFAYAFLLAPVWQFPLLLILGMFAVGVLAARSRSYEDAQLFIEKGTDESAAAVAEKEAADEHKSIADR